MARPRPTLQKPLLPPRTTGALPTHDVDGRPFVRLQTLGAVNILVGTVRLGATAGMQFSLLLRVATAPGCQLGRRAAIDALWPDLDDTRQRGNLRQALYKLRGLGVHIALDGAVVALDPTQLLRTFSTERSADLFARDVTLGHEPFGPCLPGFTAPWPAFQEWLDDYRDTVHSDVRRVLSAQLRQRRERADWGGAEALARWLLQFDPLNEEGTLTVAECAALAGSKTEALAILDRYLAELGPDAGDIRLPASMLRRRIAEPVARTRLSFAPTERHFLGRNDELAELTLAMRRARWHDGSAMLWHGAPGIGKSRLAHELTKVAVLEGVRVLMAPCRESDGVRPLSVFIDLVPELLTQPGALGCAPESLAALRRLVPSDRRSGLPGAPRDAERAHVAAVADEHSVSDAPDDDLPVREPMPMLAALRSALIDLIAAISHEKPTLLVVDDAHWIDESSWDVLAELIDRVGALRVCVVMLSREPHARPQRPQRVPLTLRVQALQQLSAESCLALSRAIGTDLSATIDDALGAWFVRASEGNPLFLRALVNHWIETGEAGGVPPTLHGVIEQRLSQLSGDALRVLQTAALLGKWATVERVGRVLELGVSGHLDAIDQLEKLGMLSSVETQRILPHELVARTAKTRSRAVVSSFLIARAADGLGEEALRTQDPSLLLGALELLAEAGLTATHAKLLVAGSRTLANHDNPRLALRAFERADKTDLDPIEISKLSFSERRLMVRAGDYALASAGILDSISLPDPNDALDDDQVDSALTHVDATYRSNALADRAQLLAFVVSLVENTRLGPSLRLRAADMGMIMSSNECCVRSANVIHNAVLTREHSVVTDIQLTRVQILFDTIFGDIGRARSAASLLLSSAERADSALSGYHDALRAGFALRITSAGNQHIGALELAHDLASHAGTPTHAVNAAWHLAQAHLELGHYNEANAWADTIKQTLPSINEPLACRFVHGLFCRLAIDASDITEAKTQFDIFFRSLPKFPTLKTSTYSLALRVGVQLLSASWLPEADLVKSLRERHHRIGRFGTSDFLTSVLADSLCRSGDLSSARDVMTIYTTSMRREQGQLGVRLMKSIAAINNET